MVVVFFATGAAVRAYDKGADVSDLTWVDFEDVIVVTAAGSEEGEER
jgi:hypothetical protein